MAVRKPIIIDSGFYFVTFTCYKWLPLFSIINGYDLVYQWFDVLKQEKCLVTAYVIMPNHLHLVVAYKTHKGKSLTQLVGNGKRFMAYGLVKKLKEKKKVDILQLLKEGVNDNDKSRGKQHEVFMDSFEAKLCSTKKFLLQKIDYIHANPCVGKWQLVKDAIDYPHSSAGYYETGVHGIYPLKTWLELDADGFWEGKDIYTLNESLEKDS